MDRKEELRKELLDLYLRLKMRLKLEEQEINALEIRKNEILSELKRISFQEASNKRGGKK